LQAACTQVRNSANEVARDVIQHVHTICGYVDWLPKENAYIPTGWNPFNWRRVDMRPIHDSCTQARDYVNSGKPVEAAQTAIQTCDELETRLEEWMSHSGETSQIVDYFQERMTSVADIGSSVLQALSNFGSLLPAAMSIAPGLLKGALRVKMLVPQAPIPGLFVLVLPWMYCPLQWAIYSMAFQVVGSLMLLLGLIIVAFSPAVYTLMGMRLHIDRPMTDEQVIVSMQAIDRTMLIFTILGWGMVLAHFIWLLIVYGRERQWWGLLGDEVPSDWGTVREAEYILALVGDMTTGQFFRTALYYTLLMLTSVLEKYYLTSIAGLDWMLSRLISVRKMQRRMAGKHSTEDVKLIRRQHDLRMDALTALDSGKRYSVWCRDQWADQLGVAIVNNQETNVVILS